MTSTDCRICQTVDRPRRTCEAVRRHHATSQWEYRCTLPEDHAGGDDDERVYDAGYED